MARMSSDEPATPAADGGTLPVTRFRPQKTHYLGVAFLALMAFIALGFEPRFFAWTPIPPIVYAAWIHRARTTVSDRGITAVYLLGRRRSLPWSRFRGVLFGKTGRAFAVSAEGADADRAERFALPAISFNSLPALAEASDGRIPDVLSSGLAAKDEQVEVHHRDGYSVLRDRGEVAARNLPTFEVKPTERPRAGE